MTPPGSETPVLRLARPAGHARLGRRTGHLRQGRRLWRLRAAAGQGRHARGACQVAGEAAYCERTSNPELGVKKLGSVFPSIEVPRRSARRTVPRDAEGAHRLVSRANAPRRELSLADAYFKRSDYLRAATFLYEAFVTRACYAEKCNDTDAKERDEAYETREKNTGGRAAQESAQRARARRPVHGEKADESAKTIANESSLRKVLKELTQQALLAGETRPAWNSEAVRHPQIRSATQASARSQRCAPHERRHFLPGRPLPLRIPGAAADPPA
jgi:hypothetical protein